MDTHLTDFGSGRDKTDKTETVDNNEFMRALFGEPDGDVLPMVVTFAGNPTSVKGSAWE